ncbi:MAG: hypothetical protein HQK54_07870 [Oligoflexales bacterium]|nr:hypothetical protein [Oligoflexales bacterium]
MQKVILNLSLLLLLSSTLSHGEEVDPKALFLTLTDTLLKSQITDANDRDCGALISPSTNPQKNPRHSRSAEAVYPFAVAYELTKDLKYAKAATLAGNWLISIQQPSGAWGEEWPGHDGWQGTTVDQLVSLTGAYPIIAPSLSDKEKKGWQKAIEGAVRYTLHDLPKGNLNYLVTSAVALKMAHNAMPRPKALWLKEAEKRINESLGTVNKDGFLVGENNSVDPGYNLAQSIGYMTLYGILANNRKVLDAAAQILEAHLPFVYPNGSIDNSWGSRSFKWTYESGTKTAPGVMFTFMLNADRNPMFQRAGMLTAGFLKDFFIQDGFIVYGPHASLHKSSHPPSNYATVGRAQSLAMAIKYGKKGTGDGELPSQKKNWIKYFPTVRTAVIRTERMMATVSANNLASVKGFVNRGGSLTNLWYEGYGPNGFLQASSQARYERVEAMHMPIENNLLPLTPHIEAKKVDFIYSNLFEGAATLETGQEGNTFLVSASGELTAEGGEKSGIKYRIDYQFTGDTVVKKYEFSSYGDSQISIIEPIVNNPGTLFEKEEKSVRIKPPKGGVWLFKVTDASVAYDLLAGNENERYWAPFPGVECYPVVLKIKDVKSGNNHLTLAISGPKS